MGINYRKSLILPESQAYLEVIQGHFNIISIFKVKNSAVAQSTGQFLFKMLIRRTKLIPYEHLEIFICMCSAYIWKYISDSR